MRWEYKAVWVSREGAKGAPWLATADGSDVRLRDFLSQMGEDGWELVAAVIGRAWGSGVAAPAWYHPSHWLYFKRPKP